MRADISLRRLRTRILASACALVLALLGACSSFDYDLSGLDIPVSAKPAPADAASVEPFAIKAKNVLYVHGLFGEKIPDVAALLREKSAGYDRITGFRVRRFGSVPDWLGTHLSLTLVRLKTVIVEGQLVRDAGSTDADVDH